MSEDRLRQIEQLCHAALEHQPPQRAAFLAAACAGDEETRRSAGMRKGVDLWKPGG